MKKSLLLVATLFLLVGCASKKDICAQWAASQLGTKEASAKLGIDMSDIEDADYVMMKDATMRYRIGDFCEFYKK